jgi:polyisoprenoid-binding protein YceI
MKKTFTILLGLTALSLVSFKSIDDRKAKETTYKVDSQQSKLVWTGKKVTGEHTGLAPVSGGTVLLEGGRLKGGQFQISLKDLTVTDITDADNNAKLVGHLKSDDFFSVAKYPTAQFIITSASPAGDGNYDVTGKLTIKGITNDVNFPVQIKTDKEKLTATAKVTIDRTKYGIKFRSKNFFENLGDKTIYDDFTLDVALVATPGVVASAKAGR